MERKVSELFIFLKKLAVQTILFILVSYLFIFLFIRRRLNRTFWAAAGEPAFEANINVERLSRRLLPWNRKKLKVRNDQFCDIF